MSGQWLSNLLGTLKTSLGIGKATLDASALTAARSIALQDVAGTLALLANLDLPYLCVQNQQTNGTAGGGVTAGNNTCVLNTTVTNTISGASLSGNVVTLPAGTYWALGEQVVHGNAGDSKLILYNNSDSSNIRIGLNSAASDSSAGALVGRVATVHGRLTLAAQKNVLLRLWTQNTQASNGLGYALSAGTTEVYANLEFWKVG